MPSGVSLLVLGMRMLVELRPDFVIVKIDLRNAYNEVKRAAVLQALLESTQACLVDIPFQLPRCPLRTLFPPIRRLQ